MKTLYLAHNFESRKTIRKWELKMEGRYNINLDNPFYDNPERARLLQGREHRAEEIHGHEKRREHR
jgi:hypothetical protein